MYMYIYMYVYISFFNPITTAQHVFHAQPCCESRLGATTDFAVMATPTNTASLVRPDPSFPARTKAPPQQQSLFLRGKLMHPNTQSQSCPRIAIGEVTRKKIRGRQLQQPGGKWVGQN